LKWPYSRFRGGPPAGQTACGRLLPPNAVSLGLKQHLKQLEITPAKKENKKNCEAKLRFERRHKMNMTRHAGHDEDTQGMTRHDKIRNFLHHKNGLASTRKW
jgi:hypothetical protein